MWRPLVLGILLAAAGVAGLSRTGVITAAVAWWRQRHEHHPNEVRMQLTLHVTTSQGGIFDASGDFDPDGLKFIEEIFKSWVNVQDETPGKLEAIIGQLRQGREKLTDAVTAANSGDVNVPPAKKEK